MNLSDQEIVELHALCGALADGALTEAQRARLAALLAGSEAARRAYVRAMAQSASLHTYAAEMQADAPDARAKILRPVFVRWSLAGLAAAAALTLAFVSFNRPAAGDSAADVKPSETVAQLSGAKSAQWAAGAAAPRPGERLRRGARLELASGFVEITFDSGARVVLEGAASFDVNSPWDATLHRGALKASVPHEAIGFRVSNPAVEVVDLGTEFTMTAGADGAAEVLVLKGEVEAAPRADGHDTTILLRENEGRRFAGSGVSDVHDRAAKLARSAQTVPLERAALGLNYVHWSFDEPAGATLRAETAGAPRAACDASLTAAAPDALRTSGRWSGALRLDGTGYAHAAVPGLSGNAPHTVAFWVRVPSDAQLSDAYAMVAWRSTSRKLRARPVHIGWNRNPDEGTLGALRTDFGGGCAIGTTPLRDGRWHHVTVVFMPGEEAGTPVQVQQYVDGRLESGSIIPGKTRGPAGAENSTLADTLWLGCRLSPGGLRSDRFRGEIDELYLADRGFEPQEIVSLMNENRLPVSALAAVR